MTKKNDIKIEYVSIEIIKFNEYNPKAMSKKEEKELRESIEEFGVVDPLIVNSAKGRENILVGGHQRLKIYQKLRYKKVPVIFIDEPDLKREQKLCLRLSKNVGSWDMDLLSCLDESLLLGVGFDPSFFDIDKILVIGDDDVQRTGSNYFDNVSKNACWFNIGEVSGRVNRELLQFIQSKIKFKLGYDSLDDCKSIVILNEDPKKFSGDAEKKETFSIGKISGKVKKEIVDQVVEKIKEKKREEGEVLSDILQFIANEWK